MEMLAECMADAATLPQVKTAAQTPPFQAGPSSMAQAACPHGPAAKDRLCELESQVIALVVSLDWPIA